MKEEKLAKMTIAEIETLARGSADSYKKHWKDFLNIMSYIERTRRWRENPDFAKTSFDTYIHDVYGVSYSRYYNDKMVYVRYPEEAGVYGPAPLVYTERRLGKGKIPEIIDKAEKIRKKEKIGIKPAFKKAVEEHSKKHPEDDKYLQKKIKQTQKVCPECLEKDKVIKALMKENEELRDQVAKLKDALNRDKTTITKFKEWVEDSPLQPRA